MIDKILNKLINKKSSHKLSSIDAYKLWSNFYDDQPDNVVLYLEEKLFSEMISQIDISGKKLLDIGCGTGRHWKEISDLKPLQLIGIDSSKEMIEKLKRKFNEAEVFVSKNNSLKNFEDNYFDLIISTLTIGHINGLGEYFREWNRVLKPDGEIIITDFHPEAFSIGMKRSFKHNKEIIEVENYLYELDYLKNIFAGINWKVKSVNEKIINDDVRHLFNKQNYIDAFNKYKGLPLILGLHIIKK